MSPVLAIIDDFFEDKSFIDQILNGEFKDLTSPVDSVTYPSINENLPDNVLSYLIGGVSGLFGASILPKVVFARATTKNTPKAPHMIHSDKIMAAYSAHVYLSHDWPEGSGTSFWSHKTMGPKHLDSTDTELIMNDHSNLSAWDKTLTVHAKFNRLFIHDACAWHCAEPVGGFGDSALNGRVVLTMFFNVGE